MLLLCGGPEVVRCESDVLSCCFVGRDRSVSQAKGTCTNGLECGYCHAQHGEKARAECCVSRGP